MKSYEKEVLQSLLNDEEAVINALRKTYKRALTDVQKKAKKLQEQIEELDIVSKFVTDSEELEKILSMKRSKIYQKKYQTALEVQLSDILDDMAKKNYKTISEYISGCYKEGFLGAMYSLHKQDIPLIFPINQKAVVEAVLLDSKISKGLYNRLGEDVAGLKKTIANEISRGISTGASYSDIAKQIQARMVGTYDKKSGGSLFRAETIAVTEGHRVQMQAKFNTMVEAKEKGADILKQWDATLDGRTRPSHRKVDGEVREINEKFSNGLMFPGDPDGKAGEVIRCRCDLSQRARGGLDEEELETLKERAEFFGLDKTENFEDFKKKYLKAVGDIAKSIRNSIIISKEKFVNYALNSEKAPDKAKAFEEALGYDLENYEELIDNIDKHIDENKFIEKGDNGYGMRFEQIIELTGANGKKANVLTAWIEDNNKKRLTSVYVTKKKVEK